ncbi:hypothetical protein ABNF97_09415 [Plantactinospora sp. B6F1]|uniref:hypothetical protein n=1 Tax=Plantactinospora sp. B6F1 TaxID=3158971 RepID=UPI0032D90D41
MAVAITATEQASWPPRVLVSVTGLTLGDQITLYRSIDGDRTEIRAGHALAVTDSSFLRVDAELPFGTAVTYLAVVNGTDEYATTATTYALPGGKVVVSDAVTGLAAEVLILAYGDPARDAGASVFRVGGRNVVVSLGFAGFSTTLDLVTESPEQRDALTALLQAATEGTIQIRQPGGYEQIDAYVNVTGYAMRWLRPSVSQSPRRGWTLDVVEVEPWAPLLEAQGYTLQDIADHYDGLTLNDLADDYATLLDIAQGDFS